MKTIDKLVCSYIAIASLIYIPFCIDIPITGDEVYYHSTAQLFPQLFKQLVLLDFENAKYTRSLIIGPGSLIPTTSLLLSPLTEFTSSLIIFRLYMFALNLALTVYLLKQIDHLFTYRVALIFSVVSILCPLYTIFSFTFWGESLAGRLIVILGLKLFYFIKTKDVSLSQLVATGLIMSGILLCRNSYLVIIGLIPGLLFIINRVGQLSSNITKLLLIPSIIALMGLSLWSIPISLLYGNFYLTTTTADTSPIYLYSDKKFKDEVLRYTNSEKFHWPAIYKYYYNKGIEQGISFSDLVKRDKKQILNDLTFEKYRKAISRRLKASLTKSDLFLVRFKTETSDSSLISPKNFAMFYDLAIPTNTIIWYSLLSVWVVSIFLFDKKINLLSAFIIPFSIALTLAISIHPFIFRANPRHLYGLYPILIFVFAYVANGLINGSLSLSFGCLRQQIQHYPILVGLRIACALFVGAAVMVFF